MTKECKDALKVGKLAEERACRYDAEADPDAPHITNDDGENLVAEKLNGE